MSERTVAVLDGNTVTNVIVVPADWAVGPNEVEYSDAMPAGIGWEWDGTGFISPQPYSSWVLTNYVWESPVAMPDDDQSYYWDETSISWQVISDGN